MKKFIDRGEIKANERVVVVSTAHGLKFGNVKTDYHTDANPNITAHHANKPVTLAASTDAVYDAVMKHMTPNACVWSLLPSCIPPGMHAGLVVTAG